MVSQPSTFKTTIPYAILALGVGAAGTVISLACSATAFKIIGVVLAIVGAWSFFAVVVCGFQNSGNPKKFKQELPKFIGSFIGSAAADIIQRIAVEVISGLLDKALGRQGSIRLSTI